MNYDIVDASEAEFRTFASERGLRWGELVSPPFGSFVTGPNMHPDLACAPDPDDASRLRVFHLPTFWKTGHWVNPSRFTGDTVTAVTVTAVTVADALQAVSDFAVRESVGPVSAFTFGMEPTDDLEGFAPVLLVWCGETLTQEQVTATPAIEIPFGARIRTGDTLSERVGRRDRHNGETLDETYRFLVEQTQPGEWVVNSGPMSAGREVHAHATGFATLAEAIEWGRALWVDSFDDDDKFCDPTGRTVAAGVPVYRYRSGESPAFRVYVY